MAKIERTKNTVSGAIWGVIEKMSSILLPFVVRTVLIRKLGSEYLGLSSLFSSILQVLNLTELGFGSAAVFAMYKPIAEDDYGTVGGILQYLKKINRIIGCCILAAGLLITPVLRQLISGEIPEDINIYILYLIYLMNTVVSYLLFSYKTSLLSALQLNKISSKIGFWVNTILHLAQIVCLLAIPNYYIYVVLIPISTFAGNFIRAYIVDRNYKAWTIESELPDDVRISIKSRIIPLMSTKLAVVLLNSADTLVISSFLGLKEVAIYNNYYYIMTSVSGFLIVIYGAMQAGIGNALVVDSHEKICEDFNKFSFINNWVVTVCAVCLLCLYQPFMEIWVGNEMMLPFGMVVLFCIYFYSIVSLRIVVIYKDAAGIWKEDMLRCYLSCFINILINIISVQYIGMYGVIGSSVFVSIFIDPWIANTLHKAVLHESPKQFYTQFVKTLILIACIGFICLIITRNIFGGILGLACKLIICCVIPNVILWLYYKNTEQYKKSYGWIVSKFCISK